MLRTSTALAMTVLIAISCGGDEEDVSQVPVDSKSKVESSRQSEVHTPQPPDSNADQTPVEQVGSGPVKVKGPQLLNHKIVAPNGQKPTVNGMVAPVPVLPGGGIGMVPAAGADTPASKESLEPSALSTAKEAPVAEDAEVSNPALNSAGVASAPTGTAT